MKVNSAESTLISNDIIANLSCECRSGSRSLNIKSIFFFIAQHESGDKVANDHSYCANQEMPWIGHKEAKYPESPKTDSTNDQRSEFYHDTGDKSWNSAYQHDHRIQLPIDRPSKYYQREYYYPKCEPRPGADLVKM